MKKKLLDSSSIGKLMLLVGFFVLTPLITLIWYPEDIKYSYAFLIPGGGSVILGLLWCIFGKKDTEGRNDWRSNMGRSSLTVLFAWSWGVIIGAIPFILNGQLTVIQALFEAVSGWTTTGLSVVDVSETAMIYLFHRSFMQYCGGLGFIMMMISLISNKQSMSLYNAEGHPDKIMPNIKKTAQAIFVIYNFCLVIGTISYRIAGMTWFDGICHSMCSLSTGGFSTKLMSIGEYDSLSIEIITIILMIIGTTNFAALILLAKGKIKEFFRVSEVRFMFLLLGITIPLTAVSLANHLNIGFFQGVRKSAFDIVSALSTTGYSTMSYQDWPQFGVGVLIFMMIIGGGIGSTAGGIKISRVYLICRIALMNVRKRLSPCSHVETAHYMKAQGKTPIDRELSEDTVGYFLSYLFIFLVGSLAITATADCKLVEAMFDFSSALSTVGLSIGITGSATNNATLIIEMIGMFIGRLEIFIVLIGITFGFHEIKKIFHASLRKS